MIHFVLVGWSVPSHAGGLEWREPSLAVNAGLVQPLVLDGANLEVDLRWRHLVASWSHGWSLDIDGAAVVGDMRAQSVSLHLPYSTGFGVGGTVFADAARSFVDLRFEAKTHRFEAWYGTDGDRQRIATYSTFTLGGGVYWTLVPFAHRDDALRGLDLSTSVRVWPNVGTTLPGGEVVYANATTGRDETHRAAGIGMANTPLIVNLSVGYVFQ